MKLTQGLMALMRSKAGWREHQILNNYSHNRYRNVNGHRIITIYSKDGDSVNFRLNDNTYTN